jgi:hypothetical protein
MAIAIPPEMEGRTVRSLTIDRDGSRAFFQAQAPYVSEQIYVVQGGAASLLTAAPSTCRRAPPADAPGDRRTTATSSRRSTADMSTAGSGGPGRAEPR